MAKEHFDYFEALSCQAHIALQEAEVFSELVETFTTIEDMRPLLEKAHEIEHQGDEINHKIFDNVAVDFITPVDRQDITKLAESLDNVTDEIEDIIRHFYMYNIHYMHEGAKEFASIILDACRSLDEGMTEIKDFKKSQKLKQCVIDVNSIEERGDLHYLHTIHKLYDEEADHPMRVLAWSQIFRSMEHSCDACEHAADAIAALCLNNS